MKFRLLLHRNKSTSNLTKNMSKYRLNPDVQPTSYDLYLHPKLNDGTFAGRVNIALDILKETNALAIHSNKLRILSVTIDNVKGNFEIDKEHELLTIYKNDKSGIEQGTRIVSVEYEGNMKNKIVGLYSSTYTNGKGVKRFKYTYNRTDARYFSGMPKFSIHYNPPVPHFSLKGMVRLSRERRKSPPSDLSLKKVGVASVRAASKTARQRSVSNDYNISYTRSVIANNCGSKTYARTVFVMCKASRSARSQNENGVEKRHKPRKTLVMLISCCLFLLIVCACLLTALVLIGKHYVYNSLIAPEQKNAIENGVNFSKRTLQRLPSDVHPVHYDLTIFPNLETGLFTGKVNITLEIESDRNDIVLHGLNLSIDTAELTLASGSKRIIVQNVQTNELDETVTVVPKERLEAGTYFLFIAYNGNMLNKLVGLYKSKYVTKGNITRAIATTKFEPTYARQAFPCFDEPNMKATYTVHLVKPEDPSYIALSNMPEVGTEKTDDGNIVVHFQKSVKMSTYLACFIVCDFKYTEDYILPNSDNVKFRVYATPEQLEKTNFARVIGKSVIEYFIKFFGITFPLPKLDLAAIPDFVSGAMEHWGLVTFREATLLYSPKTHSSAIKQNIARVVSHELAHSWFGNLVTMDWWNDLWLNEGFATYIQYKGVHFAQPDWQMLDQFLTETLHSVLDLDATLASHPIVQYVTTPDEITAIFDAISYNKGGSILRMLEDAISESVFQKSVTSYLKKHAYGNAVTQDLLDEIQKNISDDIDITTFINTWTVQMGYPVITVTENGNNYILTQTRYLTNPENASLSEPSVYNYKWTIPVTYITNEDPEPKYFWFNHTDDKLIIPKPSNATWVKFNYNQVGYYRVNYPLKEWKNLVCNYSELTTADRTHLIEESFKLARSGHLTYDIPLCLIQSLSNELNFVPWTVAGSVLQELKTYLANSKYLTDFEDIVIKVVNNAYNELTWAENETDSHLTRRARVVVLSLACEMGHKGCLNEATRRLTEWLDSTNITLSQDLRGLIYSYGMQAGNTTQWNQLWNRFIAETDANEKNKLMNGLASIKDTELLTRLIELAADETYIRSQDYFTCLTFIANNPIGTPIVWDYVRDNWEKLVDRFGLNDRYLGWLIPGITKKFSTPTKLAEMEAFFNKYPNAGAGKSGRKRALENVANKISWLSKNKVVVEAWIQEQKTKYNCSC